MECGDRLPVCCYVYMPKYSIRCSHGLLTQRDIMLPKCPVMMECKQSFKLVFKLNSLNKIIDLSFMSKHGAADQRLIFSRDNQVVIKDGALKTQVNRCHSEVVSNRQIKNTRW